MDRSFLSQPAVIAASRNFVCIRLTSYEDEAEMKFCRSLFVGRSGDVENTTFTILSPDGRDPLVRTGRSAKQVFADAAAMAAVLNKIAREYPATPNNDHRPLPVTLDARLGLDVAASDNLPLLVVVATDPIRRKELENQVAALAWSDEINGRFTYSTVSSITDIPNLSGVSIREGVFVIEPDTFGQQGTVVSQAGADAAPEQIRGMMLSGLKDRAKASKNSRDHRAQGIRQGAFWEPKLPVTDREEANARHRTKSAIGKTPPSPQ